MSDVTPTRAAALAGVADDLFSSVKVFVLRHVRPLQAEQAKAAAALDTLAAICERVPSRLDALEARLRDLEGGQHGR
jgi:hypothetical protein